MEPPGEPRIAHRILQDRSEPRRCPRSVPLASQRVQAAENSHLVLFAEFLLRRLGLRGAGGPWRAKSGVSGVANHATAAHCSAGGYYTTASGNQEAFVVTET